MTELVTLNRKTSANEGASIAWPDAWFQKTDGEMIRPGKRLAYRELNGVTQIVIVRHDLAWRGTHLDQKCLD